MNKIESARIIVKQKGDCRGIKCTECFCKDVCFKDRWQYLDEEESDKLAVKHAKAYIDRHKGKSKKKDHIRDAKKKVEEPRKQIKCMECEYFGKCKLKNSELSVLYVCDNYTKKVEEPEPVKTVGIDNSDVTLAKPTVKENLSVPCEHLINGDACGNPFDHCDKDCPANSEMPQSIKLSDFVYSASVNGVGFIDTKNRTFNTNDKGELLINDKPCFATPEEALQVAKKLWQGEGK